MKKTLVLLVYLCLFQSVYAEQNMPYAFKDAADVFANNNISKLTKDSTLAVLEIKTGDNDLETYIINLLETSLLYTNKLKLVSRSKIATVLKEQELGLTGVISDKTTQKIGKILGSKYVLTGELLEINKKYVLSIQILEVETALVAGSNIFEISKTELKDYNKQKNKVIKAEQNKEEQTSQGKTNAKIIKQEKVFTHDEVIQEYRKLLTGLVNSKRFTQVYSDNKVYSEKNKQNNDWSVYKDNNNDYSYIQLNISNGYFGLYFTNSDSKLSYQSKLTYRTAGKLTFERFVDESKKKLTSYNDGYSQKSIEQLNELSNTINNCIMQFFSLNGSNVPLTKTYNFDWDPTDTWCAEISYSFTPSMLIGVSFGFYGWYTFINFGLADKQGYSDSYHTFDGNGIVDDYNDYYKYDGYDSVYNQGEWTIGYAFNLIEERLMFPIGLGFNISQEYRLFQKHDKSYGYSARDTYYSPEWCAAKDWEHSFVFEAGLQLAIKQCIISGTLRLKSNGLSEIAIGIGYVTFDKHFLDQWL